jgi:major membrane immunogen (membrane-anchored lipoprotein)
MKYVVLALALVFTIVFAGCFGNNVFYDDFTVAYHSSYSSSSGDRSLDVTYTVEDGKIVSCTGNYVSDSVHSGTQVEECDVEKLKAGEYNVPVHLLTEVTSNDQLKGHIKEGPSEYSWNVFLD